MSSEPKKDVRDEDWYKNAPDWAGEVVVRITEARDDLLTAMKKLDERELAQQAREQVHAEREEAFVRAAADIKELLNQTYGPDSAVMRIAQRVDNIDSNMEKVSGQLDEIQDIHTEFRGEVRGQVRDINSEIDKIKRRLSDLEHQKTG